MPHAYFANKVSRVQAAGAIGAVVANDREGGLVFMGAVSGDHAAQVRVGPPTLPIYLTLRTYLTYLPTYRLT